jgi:hypothetical protein
VDARTSSLLANFATKRNNSVALNLLGKIPSPKTSPKLKEYVKPDYDIFAPVSEEVDLQFLQSRDDVADLKVSGFFGEENEMNKSGKSSKSNKSSKTSNSNKEH